MEERVGSWGAWLGSNWDPQFATCGALGKSLLTSDLLISKVRAAAASWLGCWETKTPCSQINTFLKKEGNGERNSALVLHEILLSD